MHQPHSLELPLYRMNGRLEAKRIFAIPPGCSGSNERYLPGMIAEIEGNYKQSREHYEASQKQNAYSYVGIGDFWFLHSNATEADFGEARKYYSLAYEHGVSLALARLGWLALAYPHPNFEAAEHNFSESAKLNEPDGFAGKAWLEESKGNLEGAFQDCSRAKLLYTSRMEHRQSEMAAEWCNSLARQLIP